MNLADIERLAPVAVTLDQEWSATTLREIVTTSRRSKRGWAVAGLAVAAALGGGVAYAGDGVPGWVRSGVNAFSEDQGHGDVDLVRIVDFTTPDGNRVVAWRGVSDDGRVCEMLADNFTPEGKPLASTYHCRLADDESLIAMWTTASRPFFVEDHQDPQTTYRYVYGQFQGAARVTVLGPNFKRVGEVDSKTGGYAVLLPQGAEGTAQTVQLLDDAGTVMRTVDLEPER